MNKKELEKLATELRIDVMKMLKVAGSGHAAGPLSGADVFAFILFDYLDITPENFSRREKDYFLLSNGHISTIWYASLARMGFLSPDELKDFRKFGSRLQGHPWNLKTPGVFNSSGMLGHGQGQSIGAALGLKLDGLDQKVVCFMSDGEQQEGAVWEAAMSAVKFKLDNLTWIIDRNKIQIEGHTEDIMPLSGKGKKDKLIDKYKTFNWDVIEINGHDFDEIRAAFEKPHKKGVPKMIVSQTVAGKGVPEMEDDPSYHDWRNDPDLADRAIKILEEKLSAIR